MRRLSAAALLLAVLACAACVRDPEAEAQRAQQLIELGDALNEVNLQLSDQAASLDSLRGVVARQDSTIRVLAGMAGVGYR